MKPVSKPHSSFSPFLIGSFLAHLVVFTILTVGFHYSVRGTAVQSIGVLMEVGTGSLVSSGSKKKGSEKRVTPRIQEAPPTEEGVAQAVSAQPQPVGQGQAGGGIGGGGSEGMWPASQKERYLSELRDFLNAHKHYPHSSMALHEGGVIGVQFLIDRNGQFSEVKIVKPCQFERLNDEVNALFERVGKFKPFPSEVAAASLAVEFEIEFRIQD